MKLRVRRHNHPPDSKQAPAPRSIGHATARAPELAHVPIAALAAELDMLQRTLVRTLAANDQRATAAARRCIRAVEAELAARGECSL